MAHFLPAPGLSVALLLTWLLLTDSLSPGQWLLGSVIALAVPPLIGAKSKMVHARQRLGTIFSLGVVVAIDIVKSNLELAVRIIGPESAVKPNYVWVPVELTHPIGQSMLAGIITLTPGTVSADITGGGQYLLVHAFDVPDEDALIPRSPVADLGSPTVCLRLIRCTSTCWRCWLLLALSNKARSSSKWLC